MMAIMIVVTVSEMCVEIVDFHKAEKLQHSERTRNEVGIKRGRNAGGGIQIESCGDRKSDGARAILDSGDLTAKAGF